MNPWVRSSRCVGGDCLEARRVGRVVVVRDSKLGAVSPLQVWDRDEWAELLAAIRTGGPIAVGRGSPYRHVAIDAVPLGSGTVVLGFWDDDRRHEKLRVTYAEWNAFVAGVLKGEFDFENLPTPAASAAAGGSAAVTGSATAPTGPPPVDPVSFILSTGKDDHDPSAVGESYLPEAAHPIDSPDAPAEHSMTAAWGGVPGQCGVQCACGTAFDGFDTIGEAAELLDDHIAAAVTEDSPAGRPDPAKGEVFDGACAIDLSPAGRGPDSSGGEGGSVSRPPVMAAGAVAATPVTAPAADYGDLVFRKVEPQFIVMEAPERVLMQLEFLRGADERAMFIAGGDTVYFGYGPDANEVVYLVTGWDADRRALVLERVMAVADAAALARAAAPLTEHIPESSPAATVDGAGEPVAVPPMAAGGEVVPDPVGRVRKAGTTEPEGEQPS